MIETPPASERAGTSVEAAGAGDDRAAIVEPRRRLSLPILAVDQAIYSASNFLIAVLGGRQLDAAGFGAFAVAILAISVVINMGKAVWHEPDLAAATGERMGTTFSFVRPSVWLASAAAVCLTAGLALPVVATAVAATGAALVQDRARYLALAAGKVKAVLVADGAWLATIVAAFMMADRLVTTRDLLLVWLFGAVVGLVPLLVALRRQRPLPNSVTAAHRLALLADFSMSSGMTQIGGLLIAGFLSAAAFAPLRGAIILFGPIGVLTGALTTWIFGSLESGPSGIAAVRQRAFLLAGAAWMLVAAVCLVPSTLGESLVGSAWPGLAVLIGIGVSVGFQAASTPGMMLLRLQGERRRLLRLRAAALLTFLVGVVGTSAISGSAVATAVGYAVVNATLAIAVWTFLRQP